MDQKKTLSFEFHSNEVLKMKFNKECGWCSSHLQEEEEEDLADEKTISDCSLANMTGQI